MAVYVKNGVSIKVISFSENLDMEHLYLEVIFPSYKILVGAFYKGPNIDEISQIEDILSELTPTYSDIILVRNFNENLLLNKRNRCLASQDVAFVMF